MKSNLVDITVHIDEHLDNPKLHSLEDELRAGDGIITVSWKEKRPHLFVVGYDPDVTQSFSILQRINQQGLNAQFVGM